MSDKNQMPTTPEKHIYETLEEAEEVLWGIMEGRYVFYKPNLLTVEKQRITDKMIRFCKEYVVDYCLVKAAVRSGYSAKSKASMGKDLITKPCIRRLIDIGKALADKRAQKSVDDLIREQESIAYADFRNYIKWDGFNYIVKSSDELTDAQAAAVKEVTIDKNGQIVIKLWDKQKALEWCSDYKKAVDKTQRVENVNPSGLNINLNLNKQMTEDELLASFEDQLKPSELK